ncbi:MAG: hypothetical protein ACLPKB_10225 [Xanthobacteraceae bacterium]
MRVRPKTDASAENGDMTPSNPITEFSASHLGGRPVPNDLRLLLEMQRSGAVGGDLLGVRFLMGNQRPAQADVECSGRNDLSGPDRIAHAQAMTDMLRYSGFIAEDNEGGALGYWFGPSQYAIDTAPIMRLDRAGVFSVLRGKGIAEVVSVLAAHGDEGIFAGLRDQLSRHGLHITPASLAAIGVPACSPTPQAVYQQLLANYRADLSSATIPDFGDPVEILATERGPEIS